MIIYRTILKDKIGVQRLVRRDYYYSANFADRILAIDGINNNSTDDLIKTPDRYKPGKVASITIPRRGRSFEIPLQSECDR